MAIRHTTTFGLDIGDRSMKLVWLDGSGFIRSFNELTVPEGLIDQGTINDESNVAELIRKLIETAEGHKIKHTDVVVDLPEPKTFIKLIEIPKNVRRTRYEDYLYDQIPRHFPLKPEEVYFDWQVVRREGPNPGFSEVLVGIAARSVVDSYLSLLNRAGLQVRSLEIEDAAITNSLIKDAPPSALNRQAETSHAQILLDLGANRSSLIVYDRGVIQFTINLPVAGLELTKTISKERRISLREAEVRKITCGLVEQACPQEYPIIDKTFAVVAQEISQVQKFFAEQSNSEIAQIILSGGGALTKNLSEYLYLKTNIPTTIGNPYVNIRPERDQKLKLPAHGTPYTTAIGLALSACNLD